MLVGYDKRPTKFCRDSGEVYLGIAKERVSHLRRNEVQGGPRGEPGDTPMSPRTCLGASFRGFLGDPTLHSICPSVWDNEIFYLFTFDRAKPDQATISLFSRISICRPSFNNLIHTPRAWPPSPIMPTTLFPALKPSSKPKKPTGSLVQRYGFPRAN